MTAPSYPGGCLCGRLRYVATGDPLWVAWCHCGSCRRQTGAPAAAYAGFLRTQVRFLGEQPETYASSPGVRRSFCAACGTPLAYESDRHPGQIDLHLGTLDEPERLPPTAPEAETFPEERLSWFPRPHGR